MSVDVRPNGETEEITDWDAYYKEQQKLIKDNYTAGKETLDKSKQASQEMAAVTRDRLLKYLPQQLSAQGIRTLGASEDATIKAFNNYQNAMAGISQSYDTTLKDLDKSKAEALSKLTEKKLTKQDTDNKEKATNFESVFAKIKSGEYGLNDIPTLSSIYGFGEDEISMLENAAKLIGVNTTLSGYAAGYGEDGAYTDDHVREYAAYLSENKDLLGSEYDAHLKTLRDGTQLDEKLNEILTNYDNYGSNLKGYYYAELKNLVDNYGGLFTAEELEAANAILGQADANTPADDADTDDTPAISDNTRGGYTNIYVQGLNNGIKGNDFDLTIGSTVRNRDTEFDLRTGDLVGDENTKKVLNELATGKSDGTPDANSIAVLNGSMYVYTKKGWRAVVSDVDDVNDAVKAYLQGYVGGHRDGR